MSMDQIVAGITALLSTVCFLVFMKALRSEAHTLKINIASVVVSLIYVVWLILLIGTVLVKI